HKEFLPPPRVWDQAVPDKYAGANYFSFLYISCIVSIGTLHIILYAVYLINYKGKGEIDLSDIEVKKTKKEKALRTWNEEKIQLAKDWIENEGEQKRRKIVQGGIYLCTLGENIGSEQNTEHGEQRPVIVLSNNMINPTAPNVLIAPLSKQLKTKQNRKGLTVPKYNSHYFLYKNKYSFLNYDSAVKTEELRSVSKIRLNVLLGQVDDKDFKKILARLKWTTGM
ncbi:type II toxin-antitoxin system PemK/MazF family toxin, partial [Bacillus smithii]